MKTFKALRNQTALMTGIILSALALLLCIAVGKTFKDELESQFRRETHNIAQILINDFDSTVQFFDETLLQIASEYPSIEFNSSNKPQRLHEFLERHAPHNSSQIALLAIFDKSGMVIATSGESSSLPLDASHNSTFTFHASNPAASMLYINAPEFGRILKEWTIRFSRPLKNKDGDFDGVISISYKVSDFVRLFEKLDVKNVGIISLVGLDRIVRIRSSGGKISYGQTIPADAPIVKKIMAGEKEGAFKEKSVVDNVSRIGYFRVSDVAPFYAYVAYDRSYLASQYYKIFILLGISWSLFSVVLIGAIFYVQKMERLRQHALSHAVEAVLVERRRILADMHDSIGASLAVLISHLSSRAPNWVELKQKATQILIELRLLVDLD